MKDRPDSPLLQPGAILDLSIEKPAYPGRGLARHSGRVVFVPRTYPGDRVRARVRATHRTWAEADLVELVEPSPARRAPPCPNGPDCAGCTFQDVVPAEQLRLKEAVLRESLARARVTYDGAIGLTASEQEAGWRLRATLHAGRVGGRFVLGYRRDGSPEVTDHRACLQLSTRLNEVARRLRGELAERPELVGAAGELQLLEAPDGASVAGLLSTGLPRARAASLDGLGGDLPLGIEFEPRGTLWLRGDPHVRVPLLGLELRVHVRSFFQSNRHLYEALAREVLALLPPGSGRVLDLYAGVGLFSLPLAARDGCEVVAVEHGGASTRDARANAAANGLAVRVMESDVAKALSDLAPAPSERVILDPPRTGAGPEVVSLIAGRQPATIVYVSCDPPTLARDLAHFARLGYHARSLRLVDLFPNTFHLETIAELTPA